MGSFNSTPNPDLAAIVAGDKGFSAFANTAANAGFASQVWLMNLAASGRRLQLIAFQVYCSIASSIVFGHTAVLPAIPKQFGVSNAVGIAPASTAGRTYSDNTHALYANMFIMWGLLIPAGPPAPSPIILPLPILIDPGRGFGMQPEVLNQDIQATFWWIEI